MKHFFLFFFAFTVFATPGTASIWDDQDTLSQNRIDQNGLKQGHWIFWGRMKKLPGYGDNDKVEEGDFVDSRKTGKWTKYYPSGTVKDVVEYKNGRPNGYYINYYANGKIQEEGNWVNNKNVGQFKRYHENGKPAQEFFFNDLGKREGVQKYYYEDGTLMIEGSWNNGKESGIIKEYYENGDLKAEKSFANGTLDAANSKVFEPRKPIVSKPEKVKKSPPVTATKSDVSLSGVFNGNGQAKLFNANRQLSKDGVFENYKLIDGKEYIYDKNGILKRIAIYKDGNYVGDGVIEEK